MKPCISKLFPAVCAALLLAACSDSNPTPQPAAPAAPAPQAKAAQAPQPKPSAAEQPTAAPAKPAPAAAPQTKQPAAPQLSAAALAEHLKQWDKKLNTLETDFEQTTSYDGVEISRSQGKLFYDKPQNRLRLDTLNPQGEMEQSAVTDKKDIVILDENNQHVTTLSWADWQQGQPNQALFDFGNYTALVERHNASVQSQNAQTAVLVLTPKEGEEYTLYLTLSKKDHFPQTITIHSDLMVTRANLKNTHKNTPLPADVFGGFHK